jgi:aminoglycoside/choline kinase family phosphotransferase
MAQYRLFTAADAVTVAQAALSRSAGQPVIIRQLADLSGDQRRNLILRASAVRADGAARPVIIKATRSAGYDPAAADAFATSGFVKEWAAATLLTRRGAGGHPGAPLLVADALQGVLVFADLGEALTSLVQPLRHGSADDAEAALTAYATSLAQLHAATIGCQSEHEETVRAAFPATRVPPPGENWIDRIARKAPSLLGGTLPEDEVALIAGRLQAPGPFLALVHRDPCPDNVLLSSDGTATLIDFEFSAPGHALLDLAYLRMGFPTCWCAGRLPDAVAARVERAYRTALAATVPAAADDVAFRRESALIGMAWLLGGLVWLLEGALAEDKDWGLSTHRNRILHYLAAATRMAMEANILPGIRATATAWLDRLRADWPTSTPLAPYPAFATPAK